MFDSALVWFRRDLRDDDNRALDEALRRARCVYCCFVFDTEILDELSERRDRRVDFIHRSLLELSTRLGQRGGALIVRHAASSDAIPQLAKELGASAVFVNRDYEPTAKARDAAVAATLAGLGIAFEAYKDQVVLDGDEVLTGAGKPYRVFTPYRAVWLTRLSDDDLAPTQEINGRLCSPPFSTWLPDLHGMGFASTDIEKLGIIPGMSGAQKQLQAFLPKISRYKEQRDFPALTATSALSIHLRFGTVSIRKLVAAALKHGALRDDDGAGSWLLELIWREFYSMILDRFPRVVRHPFKTEFDAILWVTGSVAETRFGAWCAGQTGYPLIDAAMRQLRRTGTMHNRLRMLSASFLCKDLGVDWRRGESWFARHLNDFDLSANNGGWQWAASCGCDAQPYFRVFNPTTQAKRFDPDGTYIRSQLPELDGVPDRFIHAPWEMPSDLFRSVERAAQLTLSPIVQHDEARAQALARFSVVKKLAAERHSLRPAPATLLLDTVSQGSD